MMIGALREVKECVLDRLAHFIARVGRSISRRERARELKNLYFSMQSLGSFVHVHPSAVITHPEHVVLGNNIHIGDECFFLSEGGLLIQDNVIISRRVTIYCSDHDFRGPKGAIPFGPDRIWKEVIVERNVWIGMNVCILPGVRIGEGAIIGMGAIITKDVPPFAIVGQGPYRMLGERDVNDYYKNERLKAYAGVNGSPLTREQISDFRKTGREEMPNITFVVIFNSIIASKLAEGWKAASFVDVRERVRPQISNISSLFSGQKISEQEIISKLETLYLDTSTYTQEFFYVEMGSPFYNLVPFLSSCLPNAKFLWIYSSVLHFPSEQELESQARLPSRHASQSIGVRQEILSFFELSEAEWNSMGVFEQECARWSYFNTIIAKGFQCVPSSRRMVVHDNIINQNMNEIKNFLRLHDAEAIDKFKSKVRVVNLTNIEPMSDVDRDAHNRWCGPVRELLEYLQ